MLVLRNCVESVHKVDHNLRMLQPKTSLHHANLAIARGRVSTQVVLGVSTVLVWAAVAYSAVGWVLRDSSVSETATGVANAPTSRQDIDTNAVARVLGAPPQVAVAAPTAASRLQLLGVLNGDANTGVALISVDGKAAKPFRVGKTVTEGLVLQSTQAKRVNLGATIEGPTTLSLDLPVKK